MPTSTAEFLARILPPDGLKCVAVYTNKGVRQSFVDTFEQQAALILQEDKRGNTVYHGCASYLDRNVKKPRSAANVAQVKSLWLDLDAGAGKPYVDRDAAEDALDAFLDATGLPEPLVVSSGVGLHVYWPFEQAVSPAEWKPVAENLKALARQHGLHAGAERTADVASILRPPGTHHRKDPSNVRLVDVLDWGVDSSFRQLCAVLRVDDAAAAQSSGSLRDPSPDRGNSGPVGVHTADFLGGLEGPPASPDRAADQCAQLRQFRQARGAGLSEPVWHSLIGVVAWCAEGREVAHEWSDGDPRYDEAEVDGKVDRVLELTGPTSCKRLEELRPEGCASCPFKGTITSPVELGRGAPRIETTIAQALQNVEGFSVSTLPPPPPGYSWSAIGALLFNTEKNGGDPSYVTVTNYPVYVHTINRGEIAGQKHSIVLRYWRPHDGWSEAELANKILWGASGGAEIASLGIIVHEYDYWRKYLRDSADALTSKEKARVQYEQFGWKDNETAFLVGSRLYSATGATDIAGSQEVMHRARHLRPGGERKRGNLLAWKAAADRFGAPGAEPQMVALMLSLGAPLMRFFGEDEGGMVLSIVSSNTGTGKSTALDAAASVWGDTKGLQMVAIDTRVAQSLTLAVACNLPVIFDEARQRDPESLRDFIQTFTQGRDKLRGTADGQLIHTAGTWQTILICGSNKSLVDTISAAKGSEAMNARILELHLPGQDKKSADLTLRKKFHDNPGWAGELFAKALVAPENQKAIRAALEQCQTELITKYHLGSEHRFLVRGMACMYVASMIASTIGIVSLTPQRLLDWTMQEALSLRIHEDGTQEQNDDKPRLRQSADPLALLGEFLNEHMDNMLIVANAWKHGQHQVPVRLPQRKIVMRYETVPQRIFISERELRDWLIERDMNTREFLSSLSHRKVFEGRRMATLTAGTDMPSMPLPVLMFTAKNSPVVAEVLQEVEKVA